MGAVLVEGGVDNVYPLAAADGAEGIYVWEGQPVVEHLGDSGVDPCSEAALAPLGVDSGHQMALLYSVADIVPQRAHAEAGYDTDYALLLPGGDFAYYDPRPARVCDEMMTVSAVFLVLLLLPQLLTLTFDLDLHPRLPRGLRLRHPR